MARQMQFIQANRYNQPKVAKKKKEVKRLNDEMVKMHKLERNRYLQASDVIRKKYNLDKMSDAR